MKQCLSCKLKLPLSDFGKNKAQRSGLNTICLKCDRLKHKENRLIEMEKSVRRHYNGRCVICDGVENLQIEPIFQTKRLCAKAMVLICSNCKRQGIPTMTNYVRNCFRCGHKWIAKKRNTITCPKCRSPYWHTPRR